MSYRMTEEELKLFSDLIRSSSGLVFNGSQELLFQKRIKKRVDANKLNTAKEYYHFLKFDAAGSEEMRKLINLLTVNETYFFREEPQIEMIRRDLLPALKAKKNDVKTIKIWSAACSNGAEPYTIAILIQESGLFITDDWKIVIVGTDINSDTLQVARQGVYTESALRTTDERMRKKYFKDRSGGQWEVRESIKRMVKFSRLNLSNPAEMALMQGMDVIFCRNVLIYFDHAAKASVVERFYQTLRPGGLLVMGQTESLFKVTTLFDIQPMLNVLVYRKPVAGEKK